MDETIALSAEDMRMGLALKEEAAMAAARAQAAQDAVNKWHDILATKYGVDPAQYEFVDWIAGWRLRAQTAPAETTPGGA